MKKYLKEIDASGAILMFLGCVGYRFLRWDWPIWLCAIGIVLWVTPVVYKAFHWNEYKHDNKQNIVMMILAIIILYIIILYR